MFSHLKPHFSLVRCDTHELCGLSWLFKPCKRSSKPWNLSSCTSIAPKMSSLTATPCLEPCHSAQRHHPMPPKLGFFHPFHYAIRLKTVALVVTNDHIEVLRVELCMMMRWLVMARSLLLRAHRGGSQWWWCARAVTELGHESRLLCCTSLLTDSHHLPRRNRIHLCCW